MIIHLGIAVQMIPYGKSLNIEWLGPGTFRQHALQKSCVHRGPSSGAQTRHALSSHPGQDQHARLLSHGGNCSPFIKVHYRTLKHMENHTKETLTIHNAATQR